MKTYLYYFSSTGNSLSAAADLASELGDSEIFAIKRYVSCEIDTSADRIGIIFPVYVWGLPLIVRDFMKRLKADSGKYVFTVATYGGSAGAVLRQAEKVLAANGIRLSAGFTVMMPGNYTPMYGAIPKGRQDKMFESEKEKIAQIAGFVRAGKVTGIEPYNIFTGALFGLIYGIVSKKIPSAGKKFTVDETCTGCGMCARICPVGNITLKSDRPSWGGHCQLCLACLQWCPEEAIQFGSKTGGRKRYHHPGIKAEDLF